MMYRWTVLTLQRRCNRQTRIARRSGSSPGDKLGYRWPAGSLCSCHSRKSSVGCRYLRTAFAVSFHAVRYGAAIMLAGHVLCGRPVDAANRAFCQRSQRGRGRMPPPRRAFHQQRQSDRSHHDAAGGAHFASPLSTWISDPVMYDDSSASRTGPRRTRLRRDDANKRIDIAALERAADGVAPSA